MRSFTKRLKNLMRRVLRLNKNSEMKDDSWLMTDDRKSKDKQGVEGKVFTLWFLWDRHLFFLLLRLCHSLVPHLFIAAHTSDY